MDNVAAPPGETAQTSGLSDRALLLLIFGQLQDLRGAWTRYEPVLDAFSRGGVLAARTAARTARRNGGG